MTYNRQELIAQGYDFKYPANFKLEIGENIQDENRDLTIIDRFVKHSTCYSKRSKKVISTHYKYYVYECKKCGYISVNKPISEGNLIYQKGRCSCCTSHTIVPGINDITITDSWMIKYFPGGAEEAKNYSACSGRKIYLKCPDCGRISDKRQLISDLHSNKGFRCVCKDGVSYPNKFMYSLLEQLNIKFETEYSPKWIGRKSYDFYLKDYKVIIEMDGELGHGNKSWDNKEDINGFFIDMEKDQIAESRQIKVVRIDSKKSNIDYLKDKINNSELKNILDLEKVDYNKCNEFANSNLIKTICEYFATNNCKTIQDMLPRFPGISHNMMGYYLRKGASFGWCDYDGRKAQYSQAYLKIKKYTLDETFVKEYDSLKNIREQDNYTNAQLSKISEVCRGKRKTAYGYIWKYVEN